MCVVFPFNDKTCITIVNTFQKNYGHQINVVKSFDIKLSTYIEFGAKSIDKNSKLKITDCIRISKYKNIFIKAYTPN